ncbi:uncharacterized protein V1518DRAFT_422656 [Limtongia smithiae]|uniref:uncharacterized protein n=1 Tax=Limtongia smithiae TaxID=1125753 RepID=UPI0034CE1398
MLSRPLFLAFLCAAAVQAHPQIDVLYATDPSTSMLRSTGYIRGYEGHIDVLETYHLMDPNVTTALCMDTQQTPTYSSMYPMLTAKPGDNITATYLENGHVTADVLAPDERPHPGNYSWLWGGAPNLELTNVAQMFDVNNLLAGPFNFDDGKCAVAAGNEFGGDRVASPCVSTFYLPDDLETGIYNIVWAWHFPKIPPCTAGAPVEFYTSCADIYVDAS